MKVINKHKRKQAFKIKLNNLNTHQKQRESQKDCSKQKSLKQKSWEAISESKVGLPISFLISSPR